MFSVLVFLQIFTLLGLMAYLSVSLSLKSQADVWKNQKQTWMAKRLLQQIELVDTRSCMIAKTPLSDMVLMAQSWWRQYGCKLGDAYYVVERLDETVLPNQSFIANYYRITLRLLTADNIVVQRVVRNVSSIRKVI